MNQCLTRTKQAHRNQAPHSAIRIVHPTTTKYLIMVARLQNEVGQKVLFEFEVSRENAPRFS